MVHRHGVDYTIARLTTLYGPGVRTGLEFRCLKKDSADGKLLSSVDWPGEPACCTSTMRYGSGVPCESSPAANGFFFLSSGEGLRIGHIARQIADTLHLNGGSDSPSGTGVARPYRRLDLAARIHAVGALAAAAYPR